MSSTIGLILAAGRSKRMGLPKALLSLHNKALIEHHLEGFRNICDQTRVVTGYQAVNVQRLLLTGEEFLNSNWETTEMRHSILVGLVGLRNEDRALIMPVDALPTPQTEILKLIDSKEESVLQYNGVVGHPCIATKAKLIKILEQGPLSEFTHSFNKIDCQWNCTLNFNTQLDWMNYFGTAPQIKGAD